MFALHKRIQIEKKNKNSEEILAEHGAIKKSPSIINQSMKIIHKSRIGRLQYNLITNVRGICATVPGL